MKYSFRFPTLISHVALVVLTSCGGPSRNTIELPEGSFNEDFLKISNLYAPYDVDKLIWEAEDAYGEPTDFRVVDSNVSFAEYGGKYGRIRIYEEVYQEQRGSPEIHRWLELYPGKLYLKDVIQEKYLDQLDPGRGTWDVYIRPSSGNPWYMLLELDSNAITKIIECVAC